MKSRLNIVKAVFIVLMVLLAVFAVFSYTVIQKHNNSNSVFFEKNSGKIDSLVEILHLTAGINHHLAELNKPGDIADLDKNNSSVLTLISEDKNLTDDERKILEENWGIYFESLREKAKINGELKNIKPQDAALIPVSDVLFSERFRQFSLLLKNFQDRLVSERKTHQDVFIREAEYFTISFAGFLALCFTALIIGLFTAFTIKPVESGDAAGTGAGNGMTHELEEFAGEMKYMSAEHDKGDIDVVMDSSKFTGEFAVMAEGINRMVNGHITVKKKAMAAVQAFGQGNFDYELEQFPGKKKFINDYVEELRGNLKGFMEEMNHMSSEHDLGDIDVVMETKNLNGEFASMADGVNRMVNGHITVKKKAMAAVQAFGQGNFDYELEQFPGKKKFINDYVEELRGNLKGFMEEMNHMSSEHDLGDIDVVMDTGKFKGEFSIMAEGVNRMVTGHITVKKKAMAVVEQFGKGNLDAPIEQFPGKKKFINDYIEALRGNLKKFIQDIDDLTENALEGKLSYRSDLSRHDGDFRKLAQGINRILDVVIQPIQEASDVLVSLEKGDLTHYVEGNYKGDHAVIKNSLNRTMDSFNEIIGRLNIAVEEMQNGATQISDASQSLSQGSSQQAASVEEISAAVTELASQTRQSSSNASRANELSQKSLKSSNEGTVMMKDMIVAMEKINEGADNISKIIKAIDEIAFQTNLLALNAAVEAARAGRHGKGFAVVAEEVKNLSERSAKAARETADLIKESIDRAGKGMLIAEKTSGSLNEITESVQEVADLMKEVASASDEQSAGLLEVEKSIQQIEEVTQNNAANSEETAAASTELAGQAESINDMVRRFRLKGSYVALMNERKPEAPVRRKNPAQVQKMSAAVHASAPGSEGKYKNSDNEEIVINLEDDEFGQF